MSNQSDVASYIQALEQNNIGVAINIAMFALLLYDYLLIFSREVDLVWHQQFRPLSFLYILNYYPRVISWLFVIILNSYTPHCTAILQFSGYTDLLSLLASTIFQITRTYATWGQSWIVASSLVLLSLPPIILDFWGASFNTCANELPSASYQKYDTIANITGLLFIILVVILTVLKTFQSAREHKKLHMAINHNLAGLILANGSLYFILILSINIPAILFYFYGHSYQQAMASDVADILGTILTSRFMLALREKTVNPNGSASVQLAQISSLPVAVNHIHALIDEEFGDPLYHTSYELRQAREAEDMILEDMATSHAAVTVTASVDIEEFPWAAGEMEIVEVQRRVVVGRDTA